VPTLVARSGGAKPRPAARPLGEQRRLL
jgi:hypothetical protein